MGMDDASERFDGNLLSLVTEPNFERMFQYDLPFGKDIGWYPDCRFTGFFEESGSRPMPSLEIVMVEFMRPKPYQVEGPIVLHFFNAEMQDPNALKQRWAFLPASYLLPLPAKVSSVENSECVKRRSGAAQGRPKK
jgi:hypothetical protein